jgi:hypothetical protein
MTERNPRTRTRRITSGRLGLACGALALVVSTGGVSEAAKLIDGGKLKNHSVAAKKLKNKTLTGKQVKNNKLTGKQIKESSLKGVLKAGDVAAYGNGTSAFIDNFTTGGAFTPITDTSFTAPQNGVLYITGSVSGQDDITLGGNGRLHYRLSLDGAPLTADVLAHELDYDDGALASGDSGAVTGVVPVTKGAHTVALEARETGTGSFVRGREISVLFVPAGNGFTAPAKTVKKAQPH